MTDMDWRQLSAIERFRSLHTAGCFVLPNAWDVGTAVYLQHLGYEAVATTSAGMAFSRGRPDSLSSITREVMLMQIRELAGATGLPLHADFQNGFASTSEGVAANVLLCVESGVAGVSIEDATWNQHVPLFDMRTAVGRIKAARRAIDMSGRAVVLTARCEAFLAGMPAAAHVARERLLAYADAGADCLYAPGMTDIGEIQELVRLVAPKSVNVLVSGVALPLSAFADAGVRRVSLGSALSRVAWSAFARAAEAIRTTGTFDALSEAMPFGDLNDVFRRRM